MDEYWQSSGSGSFRKSKLPWFIEMNIIYYSNNFTGGRVHISISIAHHVASMHCACADKHNTNSNLHNPTRLVHPYVLMWSQYVSLSHSRQSHIPEILLGKVYKFGYAMKSSPESQYRQLAPISLSGTGKEGCFFGVRSWWVISTKNGKNYCAYIQVLYSIE